MDMDDTKMMRVSILSMLYAVAEMLKKVKGHELTAHLFDNFIPLYEDTQRSIQNLKYDNKVMENAINRLQAESETIKALNEENEALLHGNAELVKENRNLRDKLNAVTIDRDYWLKSSADWKKLYEERTEQVQKLREEHDSQRAS